MKLHDTVFPSALIAATLVAAAAPACASGTVVSADGARTLVITRPDQAAAPETAAPVQAAGQTADQPVAAPAGPPFKPVFDQTWVTIGIGAGLTPSYAGSNDYIVNPLPLIVGRVGGVGISPNGPGLVLDLNSRSPSLGPSARPRISFGPAFRIRNDRGNRISDDVVARAGELDTALELGAAAGVSFPRVFSRFDQVSIGAQVRWDVLGAHNGMTIEPQIGYRTPLGRSTIVQVQVSAAFGDDSFAEYYFSVSPAQALATGLSPFRAQGGLNRIGTTAIIAYDLDKNALNGGWNIYGIGGYSRLMGDSADTPFTAARGSANQFIAGLGVGYTF